MKSLLPRKVLKGNGDKFSVSFDNEEITMGGLVFSEPVDISGWKFRLYVHKHVDFSCDDVLFSVEGDVPEGEAGIVYFIVPDEYTDLPPKTYWYSVGITKPYGEETVTLSSKYIIARSLNNYFSIYENKM